MTAPQRLAVVGAGVAGLACAGALSRAGREVSVFEKARGPGGRTSTRRGEAGAFDHGAQYFTARDPGFAAAVAHWVGDGVAEPWRGRIVEARGGGQLVERETSAARYVAVPRMSALARHLAGDLRLRCGARIESVEGEPGAWWLGEEGGGRHGVFDAVVVATPAPQAVPLLAPAPELAARAAQAELAPCLAAMVGFAARVEADLDGALVARGPLSWVARDSAKPGRDSGERWVLHASPEWSAENLERAPDAFAPELVAALADLLGAGLPAVRHLAGHRWRFARATKPLAAPFLHDPASGLAACGDWCGGDKVEAAWRSGSALAARLSGAGS